MKMTSLFICAILVLVLTSCANKNNDKKFYNWALTPPMGWNSWDCFGPTVNEQEVKANTDYMAANLKKFGWEYIIVDIRWYVENDRSHGYNENDAKKAMDKYGRFLPAENRFSLASLSIAIATP